MINIRAEWDANGALAALDRLIEGLANTRPLLHDIGDVLEQAVALRFETKTDPTGQAWAPIAEATKEIWETDWFIKANPHFKDGVPGSLLQRSNALRQSLAFNVVDDGELEVGFSRATKGGRWQVAMLHEFGTVKMPHRRLMTADPNTGTLGAQDQAAVMAAVNRYLADLF